MTVLARSSGTVLTSDDEALAAVARLEPVLAEHAALRDRDRRLPQTELELLSASGLLGITVPRSHGGAEVSVTTLTEVFRTLAQADPSIAQIPHSHVVFLDLLRRLGSPEQQSRYFAAALAGQRLANAQTERGTPTIAVDDTTLRWTGAGYRLDGAKYYCTGALFAHILAVRATVQDGPLEGRAVAYLPAARAGIRIADDWDGLGQRTTASGTVTLDDVEVHAAEVVPYTALFDGPTSYGARAQLLHAAIDAGIARGALTAAVGVVQRARPWFEAEVQTAAEEPLIIQLAGGLELQTRAAEALLVEAARAVDRAEAAAPDHLSSATAEASLAVAAAKAACARASLAVAGDLFELGGTRSAADSLNLSRFWRDARTHTLHDPVRWKIQHLGRWALTGQSPPRHGQL